MKVRNSTRQMLKAGISALVLSGLSQAAMADGDPPEMNPAIISEIAPADGGTIDVVFDETDPAESWVVDADGDPIVYVVDPICSDCSIEDENLYEEVTFGDDGTGAEDGVVEEEEDVSQDPIADDGAIYDDPDITVTDLEVEFYQPSTCGGCEYQSVTGAETPDSVAASDHDTANGPGQVLAREGDACELPIFAETWICTVQD